MKTIAFAVGRCLSVAALMAVSACNHKAAPPTMPPPKVSVVTLKAQPVPISIELPGRVTSFRVAEVRPQVNGIVLKRLFVEGGEVKAGQQLYQIDSAPYQAAYDSAVAAATSAHAQAERFKPLAEANAVSQQDYDNALAADLQTRAAVETARINLVYTRVLSPITGRIGRSAVTEGALVTANQPTALATVQQLDPVYVDVNQPSGTLLRFKRDAAAGLLQQSASGQTPVHLQLEDGSNYAQTGTLQFSEVTVDESTGSITLRAIFPNPDRLLLPGMFVHERIEEGMRPDAVLAPQQAVTHDAKGLPTALVVTSDGTVEPRKLQADRAIGDQWLVNAGLKPGDRVIVEGMVKPGMKVQPEEFQPPAPTGSVVAPAPSTAAQQ